MDDLFAKAILPFKCSAEHTLESLANGAYKINVAHGEICYFPKFIAQKIADRTLDVMFANSQLAWHQTDWHSVEQINQLPWDNILWQQDHIQMFGKNMPLPRISAWYGDTDRAYTYSGIHLTPKPWTPALLWLKQQIESISGNVFNSVLLNWYRSGQDHITWHTDAERELGINPTIASLNFGASRRFLLRLNADPQQKIEFQLAHGDLLIMRGALQHHWQHSVPKQTKVHAGRLNMTFRYIHHG